MLFNFDSEVDAVHKVDKIDIVAEGYSPDYDNSAGWPLSSFCYYII